MDNGSDIQQPVPVKYTCLFCQSFIKKTEEIIFCPECNSPYHIDCWYESRECALYGCKYRIPDVQYQTGRGESVRDILVNAEYLFNINKFTDSITECRRILGIDRDNTDAKILHNKAVKLINAKTKLIEDGDNAFEEEKFNEAKIMYQNALQYADDVELNLLNARIQVIDEKIPKLQRRKRINRVISSVIIFAILFLLAYLYYYFIHLADLREYSEIAKNDDNTNIQVMEQQIKRYEKFLLKFRNSGYNDEIKNKISLLSALIVSAIYKNDWRLALDYHAKVEEKETKNDLFRKIYKEALTEFKELISNSKQFNKLKKFDEAKSELEKASLIIEHFPDSDISSSKSKLNGNIILTERKKKAVPEISSLQQKINDVTDRLKNIQDTDNKNITELEGEIIDRQADPSYIIIKTIRNKKVLAISGDVGLYKKGEYVFLTCRKTGTVSYGDEELPEYETYSPGIFNYSAIEKESIIIELNGLKTRKQKLDSLVNLNLVF